MSGAELQFNQRVKRIVGRHDRMRNGVAYTMSRDGMIVARPRRFAPRFPLRGLLLMLAVAFLFKGVMYFTLGGVDYAARVATLGDGSVIERAGAWLLQPDQATMIVVNALNMVLR